ncbi:hypothetical protein [Salipaludibacillus sp. CUR1]|nr:hypothetical protein [Salipaludibacillus sp. CUR1]
MTRVNILAGLFSTSRNVSGGESRLRQSVSKSTGFYTVLDTE